MRDSEEESAESSPVAGAVSHGMKPPVITRSGMAVKTGHLKKWMSKSISSLRKNLFYFLSINRLRVDLSIDL